MKNITALISSISQNAQETAQSKKSPETATTITLQNTANTIPQPHLLFPHHWGSIAAAMPEVGEKPDWRTIKYKLQASDLDRLFASEQDLVGVRFAKLTKYLLIDIDIRSLCHPAVNKTEWDRFLKALEDVGLTDRIIVRSSHSGGIHVYFWFSEAIETFKIAQLLWSVCHKGGFALRAGNIETFPNAKKFTLTPSLYNGHRLPLQPASGSILLDEDLEEVATFDSWAEFCHLVSSSHQNMEELKRKLIWGEKHHKKHCLYRGGLAVGPSAAEWLKSLEDRLDLGWTGHSQTNELIRVACVKSWVFGDGTRDEAFVINQLQGLPGFQEFCGHQHEIADRVQDWMDCVTKQYWPYCRPDLRPFASMQTEQPAEKAPVSKKSTKLQDDVRDRLRKTVAELIDQPLPTKIGEIVQMIQAKAKEIFGKVFSIGTLYNYRYAPEWRILVDKAQSQVQQPFYCAKPEALPTLKTTLNPNTENNLPKLISMKVGYLLQTSIINFLAAIDKGLEFITNSLANSDSDLVFETVSLIETDKFISFTNGYPAPGAASTAISKPNQSIDSQLVREGQQLIDLLSEQAPEQQSILDFRSATEEQRLFLSAELSEKGQASDQSVQISSNGMSVGESQQMEIDHSETPMTCEATEPDDPDEDSPVIGGYLRRLPSTFDGNHYPELIAKVVGFSQSGSGAWQLVCSAGRQWQCPINMVGETWVICYLS
jgi:hypothetical protein